MVYDALKMLTAAFMEAAVVLFLDNVLSLPESQLSLVVKSGRL